MFRITLLAVLIAACAFAQVPTVPAVPVVPAVPAAAAPAAAAAGGGNIWSKICLTDEQKAKCKAHLCASPLVQLLGGMLAPARAFSGGLMKPICPGPLTPNPADLAKPADSAEGAAAKIKQDEANAKARRAAVRYLGTVDCRRYPEAEAALIASLRGDANECVRLEAALAFRNGCCCSKKVIEALTAAVSGEKTADPAETSPRVRCVAAEALERCLASVCDTDKPKPPEKPVVEPKPETPPEPGRLDAPPADELPPPREGVTLRIDPLKENAWRALARHNRPQPTTEPPLMASAAPATPAPQPTPVVATGVAPPSGRRSVWTLFTHAAR
jgi:hypothetical protein